MAIKNLRSEFSVAHQDSSIRVKAKNCATLCQDMMAIKLQSSDIDTVVGMLDAYAGQLGIEPPLKSKKNRPPVSVIQRFTDHLWWRRQLRKSIGRRIEAKAIKLGMVHAKHEKYCSNFTYDWRQSMNDENRAMLESQVAINDSGDEFVLADLVDKSVANPNVRAAETIVRAKGFQQLADDIGYTSEAITITCPSRFHAKRSHYNAHGKLVRVSDNTEWKGDTPVDAREYLSTCWSRVRAYLARFGVDVFGLRVAEPHHESCPHWHVLLFFKPCDRFLVHAAIRKYFLQEAPFEQGAQMYRVKFERIDKNKGDALGYFLKYILKNLTGRVGARKDGADPKKALSRVGAWSSRWGVRQFQFIGGPSVTVWRELRRLKEDTGVKIVDDCRAAADSGDWCEFCKLMGVPGTPRKDQPLKPAVVIKPPKGAQWASALTQNRRNKYSELVEFVVGIEHDNVIYLTRIHEWRIEPKAASEAVPSRTCVNNCTEPPPKKRKVA